MLDLKIPAWLKSFFLIACLLWTAEGPAAPAHAGGVEAKRDQERRESERREQDRERSVRRDPTEWFRAERELQRAEMERLWERLDRNSRIRVSEALGEREMEREIDRRGFERVCSSRAASERPQGFDAVVRRGNLVIVCESKSMARALDVERALGEGYGYRQGTLEWAVAAAEAIEKSRTANWREKRAAAEVRQAAMEGRLSVVVFMARHERGRVIDRSTVQTAGPPVP